jgi:oxepin-CoA hydrolase/3-oxo-5,6-dehydrosuberyl-CoA semialdehyde dehydrogenase
MKLQNYAMGEWVAGAGHGQLLHDASNGEIIASASSEGLDFDAMFCFSRSKGNASLRKMTFQERGNMLRALAKHLQSKKEVFYNISYATGATYRDSVMDIDGGIRNMQAYASLSQRLPNETYYVESEGGNSPINNHILVPKEGVAIHINAFCFPVWNMLTKLAASWLAGMPVIVKPATLTSFLAEAVAKEIIASGILPEGAFQFVCGSARSLLDHVTGQDVITFTGSAETGNKLRSSPEVINECVPFFMGPDALNACILGPDAAPGTPEFDIFISEMCREITVKSGQKCTAIRRAIVPDPYLEDVHIALGKALSAVSIGDPRTENVHMGPLAGCTQLREVSSRLNTLRQLTPIILGNPDDMENCNAHTEKGAFCAPVLMINPSPLTITATHEIEVYGPVCTLMPYHDLEEAIAISKMGKGSLYSAIITGDAATAKQYTMEAASHHGKISIVNRESIAGYMDTSKRAGEMVGMHDVCRYMQRTAIQGSPDMMTTITKVYQTGSKLKEKGIHVFRKHFEELEIGETVFTNKRTVTEADISNFSNLSWDHFYAHTDITSLEGSMFTGIVAHGYLVLSMAAGLFVDAVKGPVLLNYGLEECRFTKPVYPGTTIGVRLTVKEKLDQGKKAGDIGKGIVKFLVDVYDETGETVAIATILTMVKKLG